MKLVVVDVQPEYESNATFDIGDMLRSAAEDYSSILFLFNGEDTLGMISEPALKDYYFEKLDYDEEVYDELLSKSEFFDKGYGFFREVMDSDVCFDRNQIVKIVKHMLDNDIQDIRDLDEEDVEAIGVNELLFDDLEDYGFYIPELSEVLPNWGGSSLVGGARYECMAEVEILGAAQGLTFNHVDDFIYEGEKRYSEDEVLTEASLRSCIRELLSEKTIALGQCYPFANKMAQQWSRDKVDSSGNVHPDIDNKDKFKVVHGRITDKFSGESVDHAWIEMSGVVFDDQTKHTKPDGIPKDVYYDLYQPQVSDEYTAEESMINCVKSGHQGPWGNDLSEGSRIVPTSMTMSEWESYKKKNKTTAKAYDKKTKSKWKITHGPGHKSAGKTIKGNTDLTYKKAKSIQNAFGGW